MTEHNRIPETEPNTRYGIIDQYYILLWSERTTSVYDPTGDCTLNQSRKPALNRKKTVDFGSCSPYMPAHHEQKNNVFHS